MANFENKVKVVIVKLEPIKNIINEHQMNCANKALIGVSKSSCQVFSSFEYFGKKSDLAAATITLDPFHTSDAAVPITESTTRAVKILTIASDPPNNWRKNVAAIVSSESVVSINFSGTTEINAIFTRRSINTKII